MRSLTLPIGLKNSSLARRSRADALHRRDAVEPHQRRVADRVGDRIVDAPAPRLRRLPRPDPGCRRRLVFRHRPPVPVAAATNSNTGDDLLGTENSSPECERRNCQRQRTSAKKYQERSPCVLRASKDAQRQILDTRALAGNARSSRIRRSRVRFPAAPRPRRRQPQPPARSASCAMRMPRVIANGRSPWLTRITFTSPR